MPRYIEENEIYNLFNARGVAQLHVGDIDVLPKTVVETEADAQELVADLNLEYALNNFNRLLMFYSIEQAMHSILFDVYWYKEVPKI